MARRADAPRDLLFGLLALQNGLIDQGALFAAFTAWSLDKGLAMAEILVGRGDLDPEDRAAVDALVARHLKKHGDDPEKSLAAIQAGRSTQESLKRVGDPALDATLAHVGSGSTLARVGSGSTERAPADQTGSFAVGNHARDGGRFSVLRPHAQGGLGAVYVALDAELNREVALKEILGHHADDAISRQRFLLEAEITGGLEHPGIVPVYGLGRYADGRPYYAMRFIRGDSLKDAIAAFHADGGLKRDPGRRSLAIRQLLRRFVDVCNAIDYAHTRGILHRDIKPSNVIVGKHGETLVVDWGLAKAMGHHEPSRGTDERTLVPSSSSGGAETLPGAALGTPSYMSPEQAVGDLERVGPRSDVYSLGATLYCLLASRQPFQGENLGAILQAVRKGDFSPPRKVDPTIPPALEAVCLKAMALKPDDRYRSARDLADDVERWLADEAVLAWREPWRVQARRWASRRRTLVTGAVAALVVAALISTWSTWSTARALWSERRALAEMTRSRDAEAAARTEAASQALEARTIVDTYLTAVSRDLEPIEGAQEVRRRLLSEAVRFFDKRTKTATTIVAYDRIEAANSHYRIGQIHRTLGDDEAALAALRSSRAAYGDMVRDQPDHAAAWNMVGNSNLESGLILWGQSRLGEAEAEFRGAIDACTRAKALCSAGPHPDVGFIPRVETDLASAYNNLGLVLKDLGRLDDARQAYRWALELRRIVIGREPGTARFVAHLGSVHLNLGQLESSLGRLTEARDQLGKAVRWRTKAVALAPDHPMWVHDLNLSRSEFGEVLARLGQDDEAERVIGEAVEALRALVDRNPGVVRYRETLALAVVGRAVPLAHLGRDGQVADEVPKAVARFDVLLKQQPNQTSYRKGLVSGLTRLSGSLRRLGRHEEALSIARRAVDEADALFKAAPEPPAVLDLKAQAELALGEALAPRGSEAGKDATGEEGECLGALRRAVTAAGSAVKAVPAVPWYRETLARSWAAQGRVLKVRGPAVQAFDEAVGAIRQASESAPEAAPLRQALDELTRERDGLRDGPKAGR